MKETGFKLINHRKFHTYMSYQDIYVHVNSEGGKEMIMPPEY
jgi:hypothetical protein